MLSTLFTSKEYFRFTAYLELVITDILTIFINPEADCEGYELKNMNKYILYRYVMIWEKQITMFRNIR